MTAGSFFGHSSLSTGRHLPADIFAMNFKLQLMSLPEHEFQKSYTVQSAEQQGSI